MEKFYNGLITYRRGGAEISELTMHELHEYKDIDEAIDKHVALSMASIKNAGAEIKTAVENFIVYEYAGEEYVDEVVIYDEKGYQRTEMARFCSECGELMLDGYVVYDGEEYYCSDECLHKHYTDEEWREMYESDDGYYTQFY